MVTVEPRFGEPMVTEYALPECEHVLSDDWASNAQKPLLSKSQIRCQMHHLIDAHQVPNYKKQLVLIRK
jgi:hypothetical protein